MIEQSWPSTAAAQPRARCSPDPHRHQSALARRPVASPAPVLRGSARARPEGSSQNNHPVPLVAVASETSARVRAIIPPDRRRLEGEEGRCFIGIS